MKTEAPADANWQGLLLVCQAWRVVRKCNQLGYGGQTGDLEVKVPGKVCLLLTAVKDSPKNSVFAALVERRTYKH